MLSDMNQVRSNKMKEIVDEYMSSLQDLNMNSKPHINMLTILAEDYIEYASAIVEAIEAHIQKVQSEVKLPILYLIDSIVKNVNGSYCNLFSKNIVSTFSNVFQKVDENTRAKMWKLRSTWGDVFPKNKLNLLDAQVNSIDPAWPLPNTPSNVLASKSIIHVNPKFLSMQQNTQTMPKPCNKSSTNMEEEFLKKQKELMDLQKQKLQLMMHQKHLTRPHIHVKPELIAPDGTLKKPLLTNVPCNITQSLENLTPVAPDVSTNRNQVSVPAADSLLNGNVDIEETHQQQPVLTKLESDGGSSLVSSSPVKSRDNDDALAIPYSDSSQTDSNADLSLIMNDNKCLDNDRIQRSSNSSQKTKATKTVTITCDAAQSKNSSERSPSKDSSIRASSSSLSLKQQQQQNSSSSSNSSSSASRGSGKSWGKTSSSPSSSPHKQSSSKHKRSRSPKDHHHHHHHQQHHHHHHHHSPKLKQQALDEEEQFGGSLIVSPPQPIAKVKRLKQRKNSSGGSAGSSRLRRKKERNSSSSRSPDSGREGSSKRRDSTSRDEDLRMTALASSVTATNNAAAAAAAKAAAAADVATTTLDSKEDLDLRVLPMPTNKRQSTDLLQPPDSKKSKTEDLDNLFGKEDVDLRILNPPPQAIIQQPPTPPPPIISTDKDSGWAKFKTPMKSDSRSESSSRSSSDSRSTSDSISSRGSRDVRPNRAVKLYNKTPVVENKDRRRSGRDYDRNPDRNIEIIMKQAAEQLNQGTITKTQYNMLIQEVLHMSEDQKLRAAQRKERENKIWERNDKSLRSKEHGMHPRPPGGPRWQYPWPQPWAHPPGPFQGHFRPDFRPIGPWQNHPRLFGGPMRPDFHQFHAGFNPRIPHPPMGPNGPIILPNSPLNPMAAGALNALGGPIGPLPPGMIMGAGGPIIPKRPSPNSGEVSNESNSLTWTHQTFGSNDGTKATESNEDDNVNNVSSNSDELPTADPKLLEEIAKDTMRSINIDNIPREIRYYGHTGIIFMHWNDPRDIGFQNGARRISIDGKEVAVCSFNDDYREFTYEGEVHRIKLGAPTRELYVDDNWYQCYFGGQPVTADLGGKKVSVKLDGPPPQVKIGIIKRTDLVVGKINLIINARSMVPVFLDAKPQMFNIEGKSCTLEFIDSLQTVLLNGRPFQVEFGGLPKPVVVHGKKHFIRFSGLPHGFRAGYVKMTGMKGEKPKELPPADLENKNQTDTSSVTLFAPPTELDSTSQDGTDQPYTSKSDLQLDVLSSVVPSAMAPSSGLSYQAEPIENTPAPTPAVTLPLNLSELFQRLVETGIVSNFNETKKPEEEKKDPEVIPVTFDKPETLKIKQPAMITGLYSGIQCSSCGARFAPEMATRYSHHLDWHFRQNRKERDSSRKAHSRLWYYDVSDWIQFEEIEDLEDRAQSWFETEKQTMESENAAAEELFAETMQPSVPTSSDEDACCQVCHEAFEQFYNDEKEEWHLRPAITFENKNFHPLCLEDHKRELEYMDETVVNPSDASEIIKVDNEENINSTSEDPKEDLKDLNEICKTTETKIDVKEEISEQNNVSESVSTGVIDTIERKIEEIATDVTNEQRFAELKNEKNQISENETPEVSKKDNDEKMENKEEESNTKINVKDEPIIVKEETTEMDIEMENSIAETSGIDSTQVEVKTAIDGNVELESTVPIPAVQSKIKINIIKPINSPKDQKEIIEEKEEKSNEEESPPPVLKPAFVKSTLQDRNLSTLPPVEKGEELSALCSIM